MTSYFNLTPNTKTAKTKEAKVTSLYVNNTVAIEPITTEGFTMYTKEGKGKLATQLVLYVSPVPVGVRPSSKSIFNGDYEFVYAKGRNKSSEQIKAHNDGICSRYITSLTNGEGLVLGFKQEEVKISDITSHEQFKAMVEYLVENLAKPKTLLVKLVRVGEYNCVLFVSKYVATTQSPIVCKTLQDVFKP